MTLGSQLKDARVSQGRTQADVALAALISPSEYCRIECDRRIPRPSVWWALTEALALEPRGAVRLYLETETRLHVALGFAETLLEAKAWSAGHHVLRHIWRVNRITYGGRYNGELYWLCGRWAFAQGRFAVAAGWFRRCQAARLRGHARPTALAVATYDYGLALYRLGRWPAALEQLQTARAHVNPSQDVPIWGYATLALGSILCRSGAVAMAHHYFAAVAERLPANDPMCPGAEDAGRACGRFIARARGYPGTSDHATHHLLAAVAAAEPLPL